MTVKQHNCDSMQTLYAISELILVCHNFLKNIFIEMTAVSQVTPQFEHPLGQEECSVSKAKCVKCKNMHIFTISNQTFAFYGQESFVIATFIDITTALII